MCVCQPGPCTRPYQPRDSCKHDMTFGFARHTPISGHRPGVLKHTCRKTTRPLRCTKQASLPFRPHQYVIVVGGWFFVVGRETLVITIIIIATSVGRLPRILLLLLSLDPPPLGDGDDPGVKQHDGAGDPKAGRPPPKRDDGHNVREEDSWHKSHGCCCETARWSG